jgi:transcriptional regulator with XRE-family HTH domain
MDISERLRQLREAKKLSQGDIEKRTGLLRCYISRVENGHTVPSLETLEKMARAFEVQLYQIFYEGEKTVPAGTLCLPGNASHDWASHGKGKRLFAKLCKAVKRATTRDRRLISYVAQKMGAKKRKSHAP